MVRTVLSKLQAWLEENGIAFKRQPVNTKPTDEFLDVDFGRDIAGRAFGNPARGRSSMRLSSSARNDVRLMCGEMVTLNLTVCQST